MSVILRPDARLVARLRRGVLWHAADPHATMGRISHRIDEHCGRPAAIDLAAFSELTEPVALAFDDAGSLRSFTVAAPYHCVRGRRSHRRHTIRSAYPNTPP